MNFCSNCGSPQLKEEIPSGDNRLRAVCVNCRVIHYQNPKIIAACLPVWEDKVLLCRRAIEPRRGFWNVPAGFMELGETVSEGAAREVWEEAEAKVENMRLHSVFTFRKFHHVYVQFIADLLDGEYGVGEESLESQLFAEGEIPWDELAFSSSEFALRRFFADREKGVWESHEGWL